MASTTQAGRSISGKEIKQFLGNVLRALSFAAGFEERDVTRGLIGIDGAITTTRGSKQLEEYATCEQIWIICLQKLTDFFKSQLPLNDADENTGIYVLEQKEAVPGPKAIYEYLCRKIEGKYSSNDARTKQYLLLSHFIVHDIGPEFSCLLPLHPEQKPTDFSEYFERVGSFTGKKGKKFNGFVIRSEEDTLHPDLLRLIKLEWAEELQKGNDNADKDNQLEAEEAATNAKDDVAVQMDESGGAGDKPMEGNANNDTVSTGDDPDNVQVPGDDDGKPPAQETPAKKSYASKKEEEKDLKLLVCTDRIVESKAVLDGSANEDEGGSPPQKAIDEDSLVKPIASVLSSQYASIMMRQSLKNNRNNPGIMKGVNPREHLSIDQNVFFDKELTRPGGNTMNPINHENIQVSIYWSVSADSKIATLVAGHNEWNKSMFDQDFIGMYKTNGVDGPIYDKEKRKYFAMPKHIAMAYAMECSGMWTEAESYLMDYQLPDSYEERVTMSPEEVQRFFELWQKPKFWDGKTMQKLHKDSAAALSDENFETIWEKHQLLGAKKSTLLAKAMIERVANEAGALLAKRLATLVGCEDAKSWEGPVPDEWESRIEMAACNGLKRSTRSYVIGRGYSHDPSIIEQLSDRNVLPYPTPWDLSDDMPITDNKWNYVVYVSGLHYKEMNKLGVASCISQSTETGVTCAKVATKLSKEVVDEANKNINGDFYEANTKNVIFRNDRKHDNILPFTPQDIVKTWNRTSLRVVMQEAKGVLVSDNHPLFRSIDLQAKSKRDATAEERMVEYLLGCHVQYLVCKGMIQNSDLPEELLALAKKDYLGDKKPSPGSDDNNFATIGNYPENLPTGFPLNGLPTCRVPFNLQSTALNLLADLLAATSMQAGGQATLISALTRSGVDERFLYIAMTAAATVSKIPTSMKKKIKEIVNDHIMVESDKMSSNPYDGASKKLQRIGTNLHLLNILDFTAKYGPLPAVHCSALAKSKSFFLRLIDPVDGWLFTGTEPDLQGLPKGDVESEKALIGDADLGTCRFTLRQQGNLGRVLPHFLNAFMMAYPAYIKKLWEDCPHLFDLKSKLFYCEDADGTPHSAEDMLKLNRRATRTAQVEGRTVEIALQTNGTVRTNSTTDTYNPLLMGFVPQESTFSAVMTNLVLGEPEGRGFVVTEAFIRSQIEVEVNGVLMRSTPQRTRSPSNAPATSPISRLRDKITQQQKEVREITSKMKKDLLKDIPKGEGYDKKVEERIKKWAEDIEGIIQTQEVSQQATAATSPKGKATSRPTKRGQGASKTTASAAKKRKTTKDGIDKGTGEAAK